MGQPHVGDAPVDPWFDQLELVPVHTSRCGARVRVLRVAEGVEPRQVRGERRIRFTNLAARELFFEGTAPEGQNFLLLLAAVPEPLRKALLADADHIFSFGPRGQSETYQVAKRQLILGGEPHSLLTVRNMTVELSRQENVVLRKAIRVIHHEFANSLAPVISLLRNCAQQDRQARSDGKARADADRHRRPRLALERVFVGLRGARAAPFARKYSERFGLDNVVQLAPEFLELLQRSPWPGNVRQLENAIARCVALATGSVIGPAAFELIQGPATASETPSAPDGVRPDGPTYREQMEAFERNLLTGALAATANNQPEAARRLGMNRATLYDRLKKYGLLPE